MFESTLHFKPPQATYAKERKLTRVRSQLKKSKNLSPFHVHSVFRLPANSVHGILV